MDSNDTLQTLYFYSSIIFSVILAFGYLIALNNKAYPEKVFTKKEIIILVILLLVAIGLAIVTLGILPGEIPILICYPVYYALGISMCGEEWWGYDIFASLLFPIFLLASYFMSKYYSITKKMSQTKLFVAFSVCFGKERGQVSTFDKTRKELWAQFCFNKRNRKTSEVET